MKAITSIIFLMCIFNLVNAQQNSNINLLNNWVDNNLPVESPWSDIRYNEVWGMEFNGEEYGVIGSLIGTHIFHIVNNQLVLVDFVPGQDVGASHRDYHDYDGYLYAVADEGNSSLQILDLQYLPDSVPVVYNSSSILSRSHNLYIDEASALMYSCNNTSQFGLDALRVISLQDPVNPTVIYDYNFVDVVHDIFVRNDTAYINAGDEGLRIVDFSMPNAPVTIGSMEFYPDKGYNHSGWLNDDGTIYVFADETEGSAVKVCDVSDVSSIQIIATIKPNTFNETMPHNVMIRDGLVYLSYYYDGLQVYDISDPYQPERVAYYDTYQGFDGVDYEGAWGVYAFLPSRRILVSDRTNGLFLLSGNLFANTVQPIENDKIIIHSNLVDETLEFANFTNEDVRTEIYSLLGKKVFSNEFSEKEIKLSINFLSNGAYLYNVTSVSGITISGKFIKN